MMRQWNFLKRQVLDAQCDTGKEKGSSKQSLSTRQGIKDDLVSCQQVVEALCLFILSVGGRYILF